MQQNSKKPAMFMQACSPEEHWRFVAEIGTTSGISLHARNYENYQENIEQRTLNAHTQYF